METTLHARPRARDKTKNITKEVSFRKNPLQSVRLQVYVAQKY